MGDNDTGTSAASAPATRRLTPAEQELRLECLKLATISAQDKNAVGIATLYAAFVLG